jgi:hypothetical protein
MVLLPENDFVAGVEIEAVVDGVVGLARVPDECYLLRTDPELSRDFRSRALEEVDELGAVVEGAIPIDVGGELAHALGDGARRRAQVGRVHRDLFLGEGELGANQAPVGLAVELAPRESLRAPKGCRNHRGRCRHLREKRPARGFSCHGSPPWGMI